jgi:hypothetical protein
MRYSIQNVECAVFLINSIKAGFRITVPQVLDAMQQMVDAGCLSPISFYGLSIVPYPDVAMIWVYVTTHGNSQNDQFNILTPSNPEVLH